jgi:hypothetical protein
MEKGKKDQEKTNGDETKPHDRNPKDDFETMIEFYLASNPHLKQKDHKVSELEVRFGTGLKNKEKNKRSLSKMDYDNVIQQLLASGFSTENADGLSILRIQNEYTDTRDGEIRISNIRAEVVGVDLIQEYCRTNSLQKLIDLTSTVSAKADKIKFTQKSPPMIKDKPLKPVDFPDFNFRVSYQLERDFSVRSDVAQKIISKWNDSKKTFRYLNRVRFSHPDLPIHADLTILKGSPKTGYKDVPIPYYTVQEAKVFSNPETYEIELEIDNMRVGSATEFSKATALLAALRKCIRIILTGLHGSAYPISNSEKGKVLQTYMKMIHGEDHQPRDIRTGDFIGPSSFTLQLENIQSEIPEGSKVANIRNNYTVTDKADGDRRLLYIAPNGRIYMIDTNMNAIFTGTITGEKTLHDSLLDGEHIKYDKNGKFINLYAAFDIYFIHGKSVRELAFIPESADDEESKYRLPLLQKYIRDLKPYSILDKENGKVEEAKKKQPNDGIEKKTPCHFLIKCKQFYSSSDVSIFHGCSTILSKVRDGTYEYNTDGIIFTPSNTGVGSDSAGKAGPLFKIAWDKSFKWKPPEFNTIDFLVSVKTDKTGKDEVHHVFQEGLNLTGPQNIIQYKVLELRCGFDERKDGYINPMLNLINDDLPMVDLQDGNNRPFRKTYKPVTFCPTNPYDPKAHLCNVTLVKNGSGDLVMMTEEHEYFEDNTIVEFRYDMTKPAGWRWIPLRVRYDKTYELRTTFDNFGNNYKVANSNWHSIHNPVTEDMITTGKGIPELTADEDVYYNRLGKDTSTRGLRDFHNLYIKRKLILAVSNRGNTLIDYAVGKAGDLSKWIAANLGFVFGIDISKDNIENRLDGACARYLNMRKKHRSIPGALFVNGNSSQNIRSGRALISEKDKQISRAVFGQGPKDKGELGEGVYKRYGIGEQGFHVSSCQFAMHYFFESQKTLHDFLRNISECTRVGGYYIGTCYDGQTVFNRLKTKKREESIVIMREDRKIFEIIKQYDQTGFPEDEMSIGYAIDVYQESINKVFREYLVNFNYLIRIMEDYGFSLIPQGEMVALGLPNSTGLFDELFDSMKTEIEKDKRREADYGTAENMSQEEKQISFMNRYFVFRKMRNVNAEKVGKLLMNKGSEDVEMSEDPEVETEPKKLEEPKVIKIRKKKDTKIVLEQFTPVISGEQITSSEAKPANAPEVNLGKTIKIRVKPKE